jgi:hypothetical protein
MRFTKVIALVGSAALAACGGGAAGSMQDQARNAMPRAENLKMSAPDSTGSTLRNDDGTGSAQQNSTVGAHSGYFDLTVGLAATVNGATAVMLGIIKAVTDLPATNCTEDTCVWGPGSGALEANNWKLTVTKQTQSDGTTLFQYALAGQAKTRPGSAFVTFITGTAVPSGTPHVGAGTLVIDNDARAQLDGAGSDTGKLSIDYSNTAGLKVSAQGTNLRDSTNPLKRLNVGYSFANAADGGGDLDVAFKNVTDGSSISLHARWKATGAGRGDAQFKQGILDVTASECWAAASAGFKVSFWTSSDPTDLGPNSGVESNCAFSPAVYGSVTAP